MNCSIHFHLAYVNVQDAASAMNHYLHNNISNKLLIKLAFPHTHVDIIRTNIRVAKIPQVPIGIRDPGPYGKKFRIKIYLDLLFKSGFQTCENPDRDLEFVKILFF